MDDKWVGSVENIEYIEATYKVPLGFGIMPQIYNAMIYLDSYTEEELEGMSEPDILQMWVDSIFG